MKVSSKTTMQSNCFSAVQWSAFSRPLSASVVVHCKPLLLPSPLLFLSTSSSVLLHQISGSALSPSRCPACGTHFSSQMHASSSHQVLSDSQRSRPALPGWAAAAGLEPAWAGITGGSGAPGAGAGDAAGRLPAGEGGCIMPGCPRLAPAGAAASRKKPEAQM